MDKKNRKKKKARKRVVELTDIPKGKAVVVVAAENKIVQLSRRISYREELKLSTVMKVTEYIAEHTITSIEVVTQNIKGIKPEQVGKSLITLEQKGLVELNIESGIVKMK